MPRFGRTDFSGAGTLLRRLWTRLSPLPGGKRVFGKIVGVINPYTGSINARFLELEPGYARVQIVERRAIRNHVNSIHAIALMNLAEVTTGLALMFGLDEGARGIPVNLTIDFLHKCRGSATAECRCTIPAGAERQEVPLECAIRDARGEVVAMARARWMVGPAAPPAEPR